MCSWSEGDELHRQPTQLFRFAFEKIEIRRMKKDIRGGRGNVQKPIYFVHELIGRPRGIVTVNESTGWVLGCGEIPLHKPLSASKRKGYDTVESKGEAKDEDEEESPWRLLERLNIILIQKNYNSKYQTICCIAAFPRPTKEQLRETGWHGGQCSQRPFRRMDIIINIIKY